MTAESLEGLAEGIRAVAQSARLLIACDYDGTIAPVTDDPRVAVPNDESAEALAALAGLKSTTAAIISGRALGDLAALSRMPRPIRLVGSHGSEFDLAFELDSDLADLRNQLVVKAAEIGRSFGVSVETKPTGVVFHLRQLDTDDRRVAREAIIRGPAGWDGVFTRNGSQIVEMSVVRASKATALSRISEEADSTAIVYIGDDVSDEEAMRTLGPGDIGIKVGPGVSSASHRIKGPKQVAQILSLLHDLRSEWVQGTGLEPIDDRTMLSDQRTIALVSASATVDWMCVPRIDSGAIFARLLGGPEAGYFSIRPADGSAALKHHYRPGTMTSVTEYRDFSVADYLDVSENRSQRVAGRSNLIRTIEGRGRVRIEFAPRVDFGRVPTSLEVTAEGLLVRGTSDPLVLRSPGVAWRVESFGNHETAVGEIDLDDEHVCLELRSGSSSMRTAPPLTPDRRQQSDRFWSSWANHLRLPGPAGGVLAGQIERSALTIRGLVQGPTGALASSGSTSLPSHIGGSRNWDQRYCWLRDASIAAESLVRLGDTEVADHLIGWISSLESKRGTRLLAPVYDVAGRPPRTEAEITELSGYADSHPVRVGNAAEGQVQLDSLGSVVSLIHRRANVRGSVIPTEWSLCVDLVNMVLERWSEPDHGIWGLRSAPSQHTHSKLMCWVALDRAVKLGLSNGKEVHQSWADRRDEIAELILVHAWDASRGTFVSTLGGNHIDASSLLIGLYGLVEPTDSRFRSTIEAVTRELSTPMGIHRYVFDDDLPGHEGSYHLATGWMIESLMVSGHRQEALERFDLLTRCVGPSGLMSAQYDPDRLRALGNLPVLGSHSALINAALSVTPAPSPPAE